MTKSSDLAAIWRDILAELMRAEDKFPGFPEDQIHAAMVVAEEAGELCKASLDATYGRDNEMRKEAIQTAAMAVRFLANLDKMKARPSVQV